MALDREPWKTNEENAKVAKIVRSLAQDQGRVFKKEVLRTLYPKKMVDDIDIGLVCVNWTYRILTSFPYDKELFQRLLMLIHHAYEKGENLDNDDFWKTYLVFEVLPGFSKKIEPFPVLAKLSLMGDLEKPVSEKKRGSGSVEW